MLSIFISSLRSPSLVALALLITFHILRFDYMWLKSIMFFVSLLSLYLIFYCFCLFFPFYNFILFFRFFLFVLIFIFSFFSACCLFFYIHFYFCFWLLCVVFPLSSMNVVVLLSAFFIHVSYLSSPLLLRCSFCSYVFNCLYFPLCFWFFLCLFLSFLFYFIFGARISVHFLVFPSILFFLQGLICV